MAYEEGLQAISRPAGADLSAASNAYKGVKYNATGQLVPFAAITDRPAGVLQKPLPGAAVGEVCRLGVGGISKVKLGGTVAGGDQIAFSATGLGQVAVATQHVIGTAQSAGVSGDVIPVLIAPATMPIKA